MFDNSKGHGYMAFELQSLQVFEKSTVQKHNNYYFKKTLFVCHTSVPCNGL